MLTSKEFYEKVGKSINRAAGTTRHLVMNVTNPGGFRLIEGKLTHYWYRNQLKSIKQHFKENPPSGSGRPKKEKA